MKVFAIKNKFDKDKIMAYLFYYERPKKFFIELAEDADEWSVPFILSSFAKRGKMTVDARWSKIWVQQRIVPPDRQNIAQILKDNNLKVYDEFNLLYLSDGRCAQDDCYISEIDYIDLPAEIRDRRLKRVDDALMLDSSKLLIFFTDGVVKVCDLKKIVSNDSPLKIIMNKKPELLSNYHIEAGGFGIYWDENMFISNAELYKYGEIIPLAKKDFECFVSKRVVNTAEAAGILNCSRQNIDDLIRRDKLHPIKETEKGKLFLRSDIEKREWQ